MTFLFSLYNRTFPQCGMVSCRQTTTQVVTSIRPNCGSLCLRRQNTDTSETYSIVSRSQFFLIYLLFSFSPSTQDPPYLDCHRVILFVRISHTGSQVKDENPQGYSDFFISTKTELFTDLVKLRIYTHFYFREIMSDTTLLRLISYGRYGNK